MKVVVLGASGATGKLVVSQLVERNMQVRALVRPTAQVDERLRDHALVELVSGLIDDYGEQEIRDLIEGCDVVISCLGHTISFKGMFGSPRKLVAHAVERVTSQLRSNQRFLLMSTTAYTNAKEQEKNSRGEALVFSLLKVLLPPHRDNMLAADHLVHRIGETQAFSWVAVRPDSLIDEEQVTAYELCEHKKRSPLSDPGKASRINVAHCMAELVRDEQLWEQWKFRTPVLYNL
jgi:nucleoside-diphosphate-sugar epimerase